MDTNTITEQLPTTIRAFLQAQEARDADTALALLIPGAVMSDLGETFSGEDSLRRFVSEAGAEFTYTTEITEWLATQRSGWSVTTSRGTFPEGPRTWTTGSQSTATESSGSTSLPADRQLTTEEEHG